MSKNHRKLHPGVLQRAILACNITVLGLFACQNPAPDVESPPGEPDQAAPRPPSSTPVSTPRNDLSGPPVAHLPVAGSAPSLDDGEADDESVEGGRPVQLSVNGDRVSVIRPSSQNPFVVAGAEYESGAPPAPSESADAPLLDNPSDRPIDVIRRVPQTLRLTLNDVDGVGDVRGYYVEFEGYEGTFYVDAELDSEVYGVQRQADGQLEIGFFMDEVYPPGQRGSDWAEGYRNPFDVRMRVWAVDRERHVSQPVEQMLHVLPVGMGDLEVTLSMELATDLDIYVVEPNGNVIYFSNMHSFTGGQLDLDANADCASNRNVRYEHIFWPEGFVPEGTYEIRVDNWRNCVGGQAVNFEVIVQNCGDISVYDGRAEGAGGQTACTNRASGSCQRITTVDVRECEDREPSGG